MIPGVLVEAAVGTSAGQPVLTDAQGRYRIEVVTTGGFVQLRWSRSGYASTDSPVINVEGTTGTLDAKLTRGIWTVTGVITDGNGAPVKSADVALLLLNNPGQYAATGSTDASGQVTLTTAQPVYDGTLSVMHNSFARASGAFACRAPVAEPSANLCGDRAAVSVPVRMARIIGVTLTDPAGTMHVGDSAVIRREIRLDDGRVIVDDGSSSPMFPSGTISAFDPAIARVQSGRDALRAWAMAPGDAVLSTTLSSFRATLPIHVEIRAPAAR